METPEIKAAGKIKTEKEGKSRGEEPPKEALEREKK